VYIFTTVETWSGISSPNHLDIFGTLLLLFIIFFAVVPYILVPFIIIKNLDPTYILLKKCIPKSIYALPLVQFLLPILRFVGCLHGAIEACRLSSLSITLTSFFIDSLNTMIHILKIKARNTSNMFIFLMIHSTYVKASLTLRSVELKYASTLLLILYEIMLIAILNGFASIRLRTTLELQVYLIFLSNWFLALALGIFYLQLASSCFENSITLINTWRYNAHSTISNRKYLIRKLQGARPIQTYVGINHYKFFCIKRSTITTYVFTIVTYLINAVLLIHI